MAAYRLAVLFDVQTLNRDGWSVLSVVGDVDLATMPTLKLRADALQGDRVALDLSGVDYMEPVVFGVLVEAGLRAARRGARFVVVCPPGRPRELLEETRLDTIVDVVGSFDDL